MKTRVIVTLQGEGVHRWKDCDIEQVGFLRNKHRHIFHITCKKDVSHNDRDIEIISLKRLVTRYILTRYSDDGISCDFGDRSCEMIAEELATAFNLAYCSVLEDGENGAEVFND